MSVSKNCLEVNERFERRDEWIFSPVVYWLVSGDEVDDWSSNRLLWCVSFVLFTAWGQVIRQGALVMGPQHWVARAPTGICCKEADVYVSFLADRTNGRAYATVLRLSSVIRLSSVTLCIVAKQCVLEQKLLLRAYRKSYMRNRLVPKWMTLTFVYRSYQGHFNHCVTLDVEYLGNRER